MSETSLPPIKGKTRPHCERYPGEESVPPCHTNNSKSHQTLNLRISQLAYYSLNFLTSSSWLSPGHSLFDWPLLQYNIVVHGGLSIIVLCLQQQQHNANI